MMQTKLTLRLEKTLIEEAKHEAAQRGLSLSRLVSDYFELLLQKERVKEKSITAQLSGVLKDVDAHDHKQHLEDKYL